MNVLSPFDETVRDLSLAQHLPRIKKLLVYVCTQHWESDPVGLASYHLHELIQQLVVIAPTFEELKAHLNAMAQTLNKPGEYTLVINTILRNLQRLYPNAVIPASPHYQALYRVAAEQLALDNDHMRMKKLLYFVCRGQWTQDLEQVELLELVAELHGLTPTYPELTAIFDSIVQNVSKPQKYQAIAQRIIHQLAPLYPSATDTAPPPAQSLAPPLTASVADPVTVLQQTCGQPVVNPLEQTMVNPGVVQRARRDRDRPPQSIHPPFPPQISIAPTPASNPKDTSMRKRISTLTMDNWFSMRIEIHKFTNPLLAKYLLFMNSYADAIGHNHNSQPGQWDRLTWDALKNTDLDTLLRDSLKSCRNIGEFERSLKRTTRQLKPLHQYKPVISAILRAVHPLFADCTGKDPIVQRVTVPSSDSSTRIEPRSLSSQPAQSQPHIPHHQQDAAEKQTLVEVNQDKSYPTPQPVMDTETQTFVPSAVPTGLEQTEGESQLDTTEAEVTEHTQSPSQARSHGQAQNHSQDSSQSRSQNPQPSSKGAKDETAFLVEQDRKLEQQRDTAFLSAQSESANFPDQTTSDEVVGISAAPANNSNSPFEPFGVQAAMDDPADETIAMPIH